MQTGVVTDDELIEYARINVGREHGLTSEQAHRLVGSTLGDLHDDARVMAKELGVRDPSERTRDDGGRYAVDMNRIIREKSGRSG